MNAQRQLDQVAKAPSTQPVLLGKYFQRETPTGPPPLVSPVISNKAPHAGRGERPVKKIPEVKSLAAAELHQWRKVHLAGQFLDAGQAGNAFFPIHLTALVGGQPALSVLGGQVGIDHSEGNGAVRPQQIDSHR